MTIRTWIKEREMRGAPTFSIADVRDAFADVSEQLIRNDLYKLSQQKVIVSVYRGFYTVVPVQYALREFVPPIYYIDQLMKYLEKPYYISLLNAAELHGAAHQRPQKFSVTTLRPVVRTSTQKNNVIVWSYRQSIPTNLLCHKNSETGTVAYSSPELTAVDLVQYEQQIGGLSIAATVLSELIEKTDFRKNFDDIYSTTTVVTLQRLGYILENVLEETEQSDILFEELSNRCKKINYTPLSSQLPITGCDVDKKWKIIKNQTIETDEI